MRRMDCASTIGNGIKIIGIDHGYGNIKTANTVTPALYYLCSCPN